jgi:predicted glycosyltransferase
MRIIFDLLHPAHLNFFKNAVDILEKQGKDIDIVFRDRGGLKMILGREMAGKKCTQFGTHQPTIPGKLTGSLKREYQIFKYLKQDRFDLVMGIAGFYVGFPSRVMGKPSVTFTDDWEYKTTYYLSKYFGNYLVVPKSIPGSGPSVLKYQGYKELAYLHPNYYKPSEKIVKTAGLSPDKYVFIRLVSPVALNYLKVNLGNLIDQFKNIKNEGYDIVLSTEALGQGRKYEKYCHVLDAPVKDIHSWLAHSALTITFGDSIARESCLLGTPSIYRGGRDMVINNELISMGCLMKIDNEVKIIEKALESIKSNQKQNTKKKVQKAISSNQWMDTTSAIVDICNGILKDNQKLINKYKAM